MMAARSQQIINILQIANSAQTVTDAYVIDLSPEAQEMLADSNTSGGNTPIQNAQAHFLSFFEDSGVDLSNLSDEASELLEGIVSFLEESGMTGREATTDSLEQKASNGERDVYTLVGEGRRIRIAVEENDTGQKILTLTDINGKTADIAQFLIEKDEDGKTNINLTRSKEKFAHGRLIEREEKSPITIEV